MFVAGVEFNEKAETLIYRILSWVQDVGGKDCVYNVDLPEVRAAIYPPVENRDAEGVFFRMKPSASGASVYADVDGKGRRPVPLTEATVAAILADIPKRYDLVKGKLKRMQGSLVGGTRNPKWNRDELILALDLYFRVPPWTIGGKHPVILALSEELNRMAVHTDPPDKLRYRNANGVYMKLMNLQYLDPSRDRRGLKGGGALEQEVWDNYSGDRAKLESVAAAIRGTINKNETLAVRDLVLDQESGVTEAVEGREVTILHLRKERAGELAKTKKLNVLKVTGRLDCEVCHFNFRDRYGEHAGDFAEVHHLKPLSELREETTVTVSDLAVLCANCHRMIHRKKQYLTLPELRSLLRPLAAEPLVQQP